MAASHSPAAPHGGAQDRLLGRVLGDRYRVLSRLGEGGMGTVYLCEHAVLRRRFAVKVLRADLSSDAELVDRFRNEAIAASRIGQENVVDVVDFGAEEDGALYYVMEALDGRSLGAVIREEGPLPVVRALDLLEQISRALAAAHASGVVHRDVKPDNVFLVRREDGGERAKVIDFGISRVPGTGRAQRITRAGAIIGTPEYMAPEQANGGAVDHRADVYAAGVLLFEMLTGELPLEAATPLATIVAHQTRTPDPPSRRIAGIPPEVDAIVLRALAKRPEDRFGSMEVLAAEAARIRSSLPGGSSGPTTPPGGPAPAGASPSRRGETVALPDPQEGSRRRTRRFRRAGVAFALLLGAAGAGAAGWAWRAARERAVAAPGATADATPTATASSTPDATPTATASSTPDATPTATPTSTADSTAPPTSTATPTATPSSNPTATSAPLPTATRSRPLAAAPSSAALAAPAPPLLQPDIAAPSSPELVVGARPGAPVPAVTDEAARPAKARRAGQPQEETPPASGDLKDPYSDGGKLKDPFE